MDSESKSKAYPLTKPTAKDTVGFAFLRVIIAAIT